MKHKEGDTVRIRSKEWMDAQEKNGFGSIAKEGYSLLAPMMEFAEKLAKITGCRADGSFRLDVDGGVFCWGKWMFDPDYTEDDPNYPEDGPLSAEDAVRAMLDGDTLYDQDGNEYNFDKFSGEFVCIDLLENEAEKISNKFSDLYRRPPRSRRAMTRWEVLDWANSEASRGWVVRHKDGDWVSPQCKTFDTSLSNYQRARLRPNLSGVDEDTIQGFEVEE